jgi:hypothetical protein
MKNKPILLLMTCLLAGMLSYANTGGKEKKEDPDMNGMVITVEGKKPIKDVYVTAYNATKKEKIAVSDINGNFNLSDLRPGTYKFVFEKDGFKKVVREKIVLKTNEDYQLNIEMAEEEAFFDLMPSPLRFSGGIR